MPTEGRRRSEASALHQLVELAREKGYAIDFAIYGGDHLDEYVTGVRITAPDLDLDDLFARGLQEVAKWPSDGKQGNSRGVLQ